MWIRTSTILIIMASMIAMSGCNNTFDTKKMCNVQKVLSDYNQECSIINDLEIKNVSLSNDCIYEELPEDLELFVFSSEAYGLTLLNATTQIKIYLDRLQYNCDSADDFLYVTTQIFNEEDEGFDAQGKYLAKNCDMSKPCGDALWISVPNMVGLQTLDGGVYSYCNSSMKKYYGIIDEEDMLLGAFEKYLENCCDGYIPIEYFSQDMDYYMTINGNVTVNDAISLFNSSFNNYLINVESRDSNKVCYTLRAGCIKKCLDKSVFCFEAGRNYKGIDIAFVDNGIYDQMEFLGDSTHIYIAQDDAISAFRGVREQRLKEEKKVNEIYGLRDAYISVSEQLSEKIEFEIDRISLSYARVGDANSTFDNRFVPGWLFEGMDSSSETNMSVFIEAENGKMHINLWGE